MGTRQELKDQPQLLTRSLILFTASFLGLQLQAQNSFHSLSDNQIKRQAIVEAHCHSQVVFPFTIFLYLVFSYLLS